MSRPFSRLNCSVTRNTNKSNVPLDVEVVLKTFNTWSYKREQPSDLELLKQVVKHSIDHNVAIPFVLYWGKGSRSECAAPERECFAYLASLARRVADVYQPGVMFHVVYTDTHARLNQHDERSIESYYISVVAAARTIPSTCHRLSLLVSSYSPGSKAIELPASDVIDRLERCAAKWYNGEGAAIDGATRYFEANMIEKQAIQSCFPDTVFLTFNGSEFRQLFPDDMPIFSMYSVRKGVAVKPWFMPSPPIDSAEHVIPHNSSTATCTALPQGSAPHLLRA